jgi:hypothetical protein
MSKQLSKKQRIRRELVKAAHRDRLVRAQWTLKDLLEIFGLGFAHRMRINPRDAHIGQNYFSNHFHAGAHNPAGSKLMRRFIRASGRGTWERDYKVLTGRRYNHVNLGEEDQPVNLGEEDQPA